VTASVPCKSGWSPHLRRAAEFGLSVKSRICGTSGFKSRPSRQSAGFPARSLSVAVFRRVAGLGYRSISAWSRVRVPPPAPDAG